LMLILIFVSGCVSTPRIPSVGEEESFKYERQYLSKYNTLKNNNHDTRVVKWVQPNNKSEQCRVQAKVNADNDRTLNDEYRMYWDGGCKNGYAKGLGRLFEKSLMLNDESIVIYKDYPHGGDYYIHKFNLDNVNREGYYSDGYMVETKVVDDGLNFNISYKYGYFGSIEKPALLIHSSPFSDTVLYMKHYPNFHYQLIDWSNDEFQKMKYGFYMLDKNTQRNGFWFETPKSGSVNSGEYNNGTVTRLVQLPKSFFTNANKIFTEVNQAGQKAIDSQKQALKVKKQYMSRICKKSVSVNFIDNDEYKKICRDNEYYANLKEKMDKKLVQISKAKQQKREQLNQQILLNAQVSQANAAQRQANAASRSASAAEQSNSMQSWQNLNNNLQMQQLNNNLMFMRMGY